MKLTKKFQLFFLSRIDPITEMVDPTLEKNYELSRKLNHAIQQLRLSPVPRTAEEKKQTNTEKTAAIQLMETVNQKNLYEFILEVNVEIQAINELIDTYNQVATLDEKSALLIQIEKKQQAIDIKYPDSVFASCPKYIESFYEQLVPDIKRQRTLLAEASHSAAQGINTPMITSQGIPESQSYESFVSEGVVSDITDSTSLSGMLLHSPSPGLPDLVDRMSPNKVSKLIELLAEKKDYQNELKTLYSPEEPEHVEFASFLEEHSISFLGGGNSSNYQVTNLASQESLVLKIDNRLNKPKEVAHFLSHNSITMLLPDIVSRRGVYTSAFQGKTFARSLVVKSYCEGNSLFQNALTPSDPTVRIQNALIFYKKMGDILLHLEDKNLVFTDMKNSNWGFLDEKSENLLIMDDKSIRPTDGAGSLDIFTETSQWYGGLIVSIGMDPPETNNNISVSVDKMHAFMWGKNVYEYLTCGDPIYSHRANDGVNFRFDHPVFKTEEGEMFIQLIKDTVKTNPQQRISMTSAITRLNYIQAFIESRQMVREHCQQKIHELTQRSQTDEDALVPAFFTMQLDRAIRLSDLSALDSALRDPSTFLKTNLTFQSYTQCYAMLQTIRVFFTTHPDINNEGLHALQEQFETCKPYNIEQLDADLKGTLEEIKEFELTSGAVSDELDQQHKIKTALIELKNEQTDSDANAIDNKREKPNEHNL